MKNILGYRDFLLKNKIKETIEKSVNYNKEKIELAELICFFETSKQKSWLVATNKRVYIILDDIRKEKVAVNQSFRLDVIYFDTKLNIKIDHLYKPLTGRIFFPKATRGWLYSKKLYPNHKDLYRAIEETIKKHM